MSQIPAPSGPSEVARHDVRSRRPGTRRAAFRPRPTPTPTASIARGAVPAVAADPS